MKTSKEWIEHFRENATQERVDWNVKPGISQSEVSRILPSLQAWQLGETSDGTHLLRASAKYAESIHDHDYITAVRLFIKEEQKHGNNLGKYLDSIHKPRIKQNWGDTLFRKIRYFNTNMEIWTLAVITVESAAQVFYQSLKDATACSLLKQICTDILIDEAYHIDFQCERMDMIFNAKTNRWKSISSLVYPVFFFATSLIIWFAHKNTFQAGGVHYNRFMRKMRYKYAKTLHKISKKSFHTKTYSKNQHFSEATAA